MDIKPFLFFKFKRLLSLELLYENDDLKINSFLLENVKEELKIKDISLEEAEKCPLKIVLNISLKEVIFKTFRTEKESNAFLSNLDRDEFYVQKIQGETSFYLSIIRKDKLSEIIGKTGLEQSRIVAINLGGAILLKYFTRMNVPLKCLNIGPHQYILIESNWHYSLLFNNYENEIFTLLNEEFNEYQFLPFISGLQFLSDAQNHQFLNCHFAEENGVRAISNYNSMQVLKLTVFALAALLCFHLSVDYFLQKKKDQVQTNQRRLIQRLDLLQKIKVENEKLSTSLGTSGKAYHLPVSYLLDRIASKTSNKIQFDRLSAFPLISKQNEKPVYDINRIILFGSSKDNRDLSFWLNELKEVPFLESKAYNSLARNNRKFIDFELQLNLKP